MASYEREKVIVAEAKATKVRYEHRVESGVTLLVRRFPDIRDQDVSTVLDYLNTLTTVENPLVDGLVYAGTWTIVKNLDGSLRQEEEQQGVVQILRMGTHSDTTGSLQSSDCRTAVYRKFYFAVDSIPACPAKTGTTTYDRGPVYYDPDTGTYNTFIDIRVVIARDDAVNATVEDSALESTTEEQDLGVTSVPTASASAGTIVSHDVRVRDDCSKDIVKRTRTAKPVVAEWTAGSTTQIVNEALYANYSYPYNPGPATQAGHLYSASASLNPFGLYNTNLRLEQAVYGCYEFASSRTPFRGELTVLYDHVYVPIDAPLPESGAYTSRFDRNREGTYSGRVVYTYSTSEGVAPFQSLYTPLRQANTDIYRSVPAPIAAPDISDVGITYRAENNLTDDGLYDARLVTEQSTYHQFHFVGSVGPLATTRNSVYRNNADVAVLPDSSSLVQGETYRTELRLNDDRTYDQTVQHTVAGGDAQAVFHSRETALSNEDTRIYRATTSPVEAPAPITQGHVYDVSNELRDDGLYNARGVYRTSVEGSLVWKSGSGAVAGDAFTALYTNYRTNVDAPSTSTGQYRVNSRINEDATYNVEVVYQEPRTEGSGDFEYVSADTQNTRVYNRTYYGRSLPIEAPSANSAVYQVTNQLVEDGTYTTTALYRRSKPFAFYDAWSSKGGSTLQYTYRNQDYGAIDTTVVQDILSGRTNELNDVRRAVNDDGSEDVVVTSRPNIQTVGGGAYWASFTEAFGTYKTEFRYANSTDQRRTWKFAVYIMQTDTRSNAFGLLNNAFTGHNENIYDSDVDIVQGGDNFRAFYRLCLSDTGWV